MTGDELQRIETVFHPTDFSPASEIAFAHALAIALVSQSSLTLLHAGGRAAENWQRFPPVRKTLVRWGLLEPGSSHDAVLKELSVGIAKIDSDGDPLKVCLDYVATEGPDLAVFATEGRSGLAGWLWPSTGGGQAHSVHRALRARGLSPDGRPGRWDPFAVILVPVDHSPRIAPALRHAARMAEAFGARPVGISCLHVGHGAPHLPVPEANPAWTLSGILAKGPVVDTILDAADDADLVVIPTDGRDGLFDAFRGSVTERVVREASCPVLAVPAPPAHAATSAK